MIVDVYAPTNDTTEQVKDEFWVTLQETIEDIPPRKEIILMGDMNSRVGVRGPSTVIGKFGEREANNNGE